MTELENKIAEKILEKMDLDQLIEKIGLDVLTDKIAEKAAEMIVAKEYPSTPIIPSNPINPFSPGAPWTTPPTAPPITVMYGVAVTDFKPLASEQDASVASASTYYVKEGGSNE